MPEDFGPVTVITDTGTFDGYLTPDDSIRLAAPVMLGPTPCNVCKVPVIWRTGAYVAMMPDTFQPHVVLCRCDMCECGREVHLGVTVGDVCGLCMGGDHAPSA